MCDSACDISFVMRRCDVRCFSPRCPHLDNPLLPACLCTFPPALSLIETLKGFFAEVPSLSQCFIFQQRLPLHQSPNPLPHPLLPQQFSRSRYTSQLSAVTQPFNSSNCLAAPLANPETPSSLGRPSPKEKPLPVTSNIDCNLPSLLPFRAHTSGGPASGLKDPSFRAVGKSFRLMSSI